MNILHFAIENFARIPFNLVQSERKMGHHSILVTPYKPKYHFDDEDYCLYLPFVANTFLARFKQLIKYDRVNRSNNRSSQGERIVNWHPGSTFNQFLFWIRDLIWEKKTRKFLNKIDIGTYNLLVLDGGAGFLRSGKIVKELKSKGMKVMITYCGSDFRSRGPIAHIEKLADYRLTFEHDHHVLDPTLDFYFAPYSFPDYYTPKPTVNPGKIRIGHAPTSRLVKGTGKILEILNEIKRDYPIEIILIENKSHKEALILKESCHIFIDNIGEIGYGINSLESLYMGIPTAVQIMPDLEKLIPGHPFININMDTIKEKLIQLIEENTLREHYAKMGKKWVLEHHNSDKIAHKLLEKINDN